MGTSTGLALYTDVHFCETPPHDVRKARKACIREGLAFEAEVQIWLDKQLGFRHHRNRWIRYKDEEGTIRHAQPDSFLESSTDIWIYEMKLRHTPNSARQLALYGELLAELFPGKAIHLIECYKYWDWVIYPSPIVELGMTSWQTDLQGKIGLLHYSDTWRISHQTPDTTHLEKCNEH